jgi:hypothetical protein
VRPKRLKKRLDALVDDLRAGPLAETRLLANFTLHAALLRNPNSGARLDDDGKVISPLPDEAISAIYHVDMLTWNDDRDALTFADELWSSIEQFVDNMITAFEKAVPKRLRR